MIIGLDASFAINDQSGIGRYSKNLIKNILKFDKNNHYVLFFNFFNNKKYKLSKIDELIGQSKNVKTIINNFPGKIKDWLWDNTVISPIDLFFKNIDIYHAVCFQAMPDKIPKNIKTILTIHDLTYFLDKKFHLDKTNYYISKTKKAIKNANYIISDSLSTKKDIIKYFPNHAEISVIPLGIEENFFQILDKKNNIKSKYTNSKEYLLSVATIEPRKNLKKLIESYSNLPINIQDKYKLLLVGKKGWEDLLNINNKNVITTGFVSDSDLLNIYSSAKIFLYPSLYEGFGLPPLEAMAQKIPVITSNISSLPEVVNNAAIKINPSNVDEIRNSIIKLLSDKILYKHYQQAGFKNAKLFSWDKTTQNTLKIYNNVFKQIYKNNK